MISVIGGGPVGSYSAYQLAKRGFDVDVFEAKRKIGVPVQCTGILTDSINNMIKLDSDVVVNRMKFVKVVAPSGEEVRIKSKDIVVDRVKFDNYLAEMAKSEGVKYNLGSKYSGMAKSGIRIKKGIEINNKKSIIKINNKEITTDAVVGADGPLSPVAKSAGLYGEREFYTGLQARIPYKSDGDEYVVYLGEEICPGFFAWIVPEDEKHARAGLAVKGNPKWHFEAFMKRLGSPRIPEKQGGIIPIHDRKLPIEKDNIYLVGDAASQVKPTTGGGIVPGMRAGECLARALSEKKSYTGLAKKHVGRNLFVDSIIRKVLDRMSDDDYNNMIRRMGRPGIRKILAETDRDSQVRLAVKILVRCPWLSKYALKAI